MKIADVAKLSSLDRFLYFVKERESIRLKKEAGEPRPWTDDEILQRYRFCNIRRMDDKVSRWLLDNWYKPYFDHPNMLIACTLARHFNKPESLEAIGFPETWKPKLVKIVLSMMKNRGEKVFNAAYIVSGGLGGGNRIVKSRDKIAIVVNCVVQPLIDIPPTIDTKSMERCVATLADRQGLGSFMAGQIVADLRWAIKGSWADRDTWAARGPGSTRGMCRLHGLPVAKTGLTQTEFTHKLLNLIEVCKRRLGSLVAKLEAHDFQNCLCEFDKMERCLWGQGKPKQLYNGLG